MNVHTFYYFSIYWSDTSLVNKTVSDFFQRCKCLFMNVHTFYYFSIYWSDTSLVLTLKSPIDRYIIKDMVNI